MLVGWLVGWLVGFCLIFVVVVVFLFCFVLLLLFVCFGGGDFCVVGFCCCFGEGLLIFPDYTGLKDIYFKLSVQLSFSSRGQTNSSVVSNNYDLNVL